MGCAGLPVTHSLTEIAEERSPLRGAPFCTLMWEGAGHREPPSTPRELSLHAEQV